MTLAQTRITTTSNYAFLNASYREAKRGLYLENLERQRLGDEYYVNPDRLRSVGLEGGSRSGKTYDMSTFICEYVNTFSNKIIVIGRDKLTRLKRTLYVTLKDVWRQFHGTTKPFNKSATPIEYNGNTIYFIGINEDPELAHGLEPDLAWVNESMNCRKETVFQILQRTKEFAVLDYNPTAPKSWCFELEKKKSHKIHFSTALTNPYCPPNSRLMILSYEPTHPKDRDLPEGERRPHPTNVAEGTADYFKWQVYGLGKRGKSEDMIFQSYEIFDDEPKEYDWVAYGGDFGTDAPSVLVKVWRKGVDLYLKEEFRFYLKDAVSQEKTYNIALAKKIKETVDLSVIQIWDSADTKAIRDLRLEGIENAVSARKGKDSVDEGIKKMQSSRIHIHRDSVYLMSEFDSYIWERRADGEYFRNQSGNRVPRKKDDHGIDASRYADFYHSITR